MPDGHAVASFTTFNCRHAHRHVGQLGGPERSWKARFWRMHVLQTA